MFLPRMINFIILSIFVLLQRKTFGYQNANITAVPTNVAPGNSIVLTCDYIGSGKVSAVSWFNGSNSDVLILTPGSTVPQCDIFATINTTFDPTRISCECNEPTNRYTLKINHLGTEDANVKWSCTFLDPLPCPRRAEYTIHLTATTQSTVTVIQANEINATNTRLLAPIVVGVFVLIIITIMVCLFMRRIKILIRHDVFADATGNHVRAEDETADCANGLLARRQKQPSQSQHDLHSSRVGEPTKCLENNTESSGV